jgi:ABC-2 type transport system ATP-binding protein
MKSQGKTVALATHYIEEAEHLCDRVAIIDHGRLLALDHPAQLIGNSRSTGRIEILSSKSLKLDALTRLPGIHSAQQHGNHYVLLTSFPYVSGQALLEYLQQAAIEVQDIRLARASLEDVFVDLTGRTLR